ncbi:MAG: DUF2065 domain-containing protein [Gammaproteobacteria bacterium]|nr:DUF2065 domain-containing protein [Gammaproteobacteria bacterium]
MIWDDFLAAVALVMVFEGLFPSALPAVYRSALAKMSRSDDRSLRTTGLVLMTCGALLLYWVRGR